MIYLDFNATTPVDERVLDAMLPLFTDTFANASSAQHLPGQEVAELVEEARHAVATLVGSEARNVIFTSGATEAAALAIDGILTGGKPSRRRILVAATEHKAILEAAHRSATSRQGSVETIPVDSRGHVDIDWLESSLGPDVAVVAIMLANNETGTLFAPSEAADLVHGCGALLLCDATQAAGKVPIDLEACDVDLALLSAHKMYGPKGVGALVANRSVQRDLVPIVAGGGQEFGLRGGTLNSPGIVGFGQAATLASKELDHDTGRMSALVACLRSHLEADLAGVELNGDEHACLPNTVNLRFVGADADAVMVGMPDVAVSSGSACQSSVPGPSHVLRAMGQNVTAASESIRFSIGRPTTVGEIDRAVSLVIDAVERVRTLDRP